MFQKNCQNTKLSNHQLFGKMSFCWGQDPSVAQRNWRLRTMQFLQCIKAWILLQEVFRLHNSLQLSVGSLEAKPLFWDFRTTTSGPFSEVFSNMSKLSRDSCYRDSCVDFHMLDYQQEDSINHQADFSGLSFGPTKSIERQAACGLDLFICARHVECPVVSLPSNSKHVIKTFKLIYINPSVPLMIIITVYVILSLFFVQILGNI